MPLVSSIGFENERADLAETLPSRWLREHRDREIPVLLRIRRVLSLRRDLYGLPPHQVSGMLQGVGYEQAEIRVFRLQGKGNRMKGKTGMLSEEEYVKKMAVYQANMRRADRHVDLFFETLGVISDFQGGRPCRSRIDKLVPALRAAIDELDNTSSKRRLMAAKGRTTIAQDRRSRPDP